jgi:hypothetical protein
MFWAARPESHITDRGSPGASRRDDAMTAAARHVPNGPIGQCRRRAPVMAERAGGSWDGVPGIDDGTQLVGRDGVGR